MATNVRVDDHPSGVVTVKEADGPDAARLAREVDLLQRVRHPGLVEVVEAVVHDDDDDERAVRLTTRFVGSRSLATTRLRSVEQTAAVVASVATTLADLHALGVTHGRVEPAHVLLDVACRPVLCSPSGQGAPADDVGAVGDLLAHLLAAELDAEPLPEQRFSLRRSRPRWRGHQQRALLDMADQARADDHLRRPTARALAATIHDLVPSAAFDDGSGTATPTGHGATSSDEHGRPTDDEHEQGRPPSARWSRPMAVVAAVAGIGLLGAGGWTLVGRPAQPAPPTDRDACPTDASDDRVDVDGDGCAEPVHAADGIVTVGQRRWAVGEPSDVVAVGDWDCDGRATAALLRPDTGEVFLFDDWAGPDDELEAVPAAIVDDAATMEAVGQPSRRCHRLEVRDDEGHRHPVFPLEGR